MTELQVQKYLRSGKTLEQLNSDYGINARRHGVFSNLVCLKYDQIDSPRGERIVQECRGLVLNENDNWNVVCRSYDKFFNFGEREVEKRLDWASARVYEKLDGTMITIYNYDHAWHVATTGTADGAGTIQCPDGMYSFSSLFKKVWKELKYKFPDSSDCGRDLCYIFELMTPYNKVVVQHTECKIALHGVRNRVTGEEFRPEPFADQYGWDCVYPHDLDFTPESIQDIANQLDGCKSEGFVLVDKNFFRVKVKSQDYVAKHHLRDGMSTRRMLEILMVNESDEFLTYWPEWKPLYDDIKAKLAAYTEKLENGYDQIKHITDRKEFALAAQKLGINGPAFSIYTGKAKDMRDFIAHMTVNKLEEAIGLKFKALNGTE